MLGNLNNKKWSTWTSIGYLAPAVIAYLQGAYFLSILLVGMTVVSISYHYIKPSGVDWWWGGGKSLLHRIALAVDTGLALLISFFIIKIVLTSNFIPLGILILGVGIASLGFFMITNDKYETYHGIWHLMSSLVVIFSLIL